uniref:Uncharacterized protein n=2 Tax=Pseudo-nitzschia australis TaxID=44445 RepID=A0A7S4EFH5_9STRA|mmetsp:Transcript_27228/g.59977  ORF Transcript_27228/g.59977 Transcript_27228/m.59977 type:complete len:532 (-) Transcript_27228:319-1914(-)
MIEFRCFIPILSGFQCVIYHPSNETLFPAIQNQQQRQRQRQQHHNKKSNTVSNMKFSRSLALAVHLSIVTSVVNGFIPLSGRRTSSPVTKISTRLHYDIQRDPQPNDNVWSILSNTEKWISNTLAEAQTGSSNPLSRKEVSYVCETSNDPAMIVANVFRKIKEVRQLGESHAQDQEALVDEKGEDKHNRVTLRQTQVLVIPSNEELNENFHVFDAIINKINQARKAARDLVTDYSLEKLDEQMYGEGEDRDWVVSVNCAHLHPKYGEKTPEQELKEMQEEEEEGEIDLNLREYKKQRIVARRSPYPSVVIEVRSMTPPDFTPPPPVAPTSPKSIDEIDIGDSIGDESPPSADDTKIDADLVSKLEALFSKSSLDSSGNQEGNFYESIGSHIETFSSVTPLMVAQNWIDQNDPSFEVTRCAFTVSDATHVDEAYEFVFTNLGMQTSQFLENKTSADVQQQAKDAQKRQYMVLPHFLSSSATSLEKFTTQVKQIIRTLPSIGDKVDLTYFHPEAVDEKKRCPVPVIILQWKED